MTGRQRKGGSTMRPTMRTPHPVPRSAAAALAAGLLATAVAAAPLSPAAATAPASVTTAVAPTAVHPAALAPASVLQPNGCTGSGADVTCDLYARTGSVTLPVVGATTVWSFTSTDTGTVAAVGPTLVVRQGQNVTLSLHNTLDEPVSLSLPQVDGFGDDTAGAAAGGTKTYPAFTASRPGTYLYQAGATANGTRQAAMGLVGALVVLPATAGGWVDEAALLLTDVDPGLNAHPADFDMRNFSPRVHLINGVAFPDTYPPGIPVTAGGHTLLRVLNGGIVQHAIGVLGTTQQVVAGSSRPLPHPYGVAAENLSAGDTMDFLVEVPAGDGLKYAVYDASSRMDNDGATGAGNIVAFGGALTFLVASGSAPPTTSGPTVSDIAITPSRSGPAGGVTFSATLTPDTLSGAALTAAEYVVDDPAAAAGSGVAITVPASGAPVTLSDIPLPTDALATGPHTLLVRAADVNGWGALNGKSFTVDRSGPAITGLTTGASATNSSTPLSFSGSATDAGGGTVGGVTWSVDGGAPGGAASIGTSSGSSASFSGSLPTTDLSEGTHYLTATATDDLGNIGPAGPAGSPQPGTAFLVDRTAPTTSDVVVTPSPNNGSQGVAYDPTSIEVRASFTDPASPTPSGVVAGEGFLGAAGDPGTGFPLVVSGSPAVLVGTVPLSQLTSLPDGTTPVWVRAKDSAGNWGDATSGSLVIDRRPLVSGVTVTPAATSTAASVGIAGTASGPAGTRIGRVEYFIGTDPGVGLGTALTVVSSATPTTTFSGAIPVAARSVGTLTISVRAQTTSGTWGPVTTATVELQPLFADSFDGDTLAPPWAGVVTGNAGTATRIVPGIDGSAGSLGVTVSSRTSTGYVRTPVAPTAVPTYRVQFTLGTGTASTNVVTGNNWLTVFAACTTNTCTGNSRPFRVEYRRTSTTAVPSVRLVVRTGNGNGSDTAYPAVGLTNAPSANNVLRVDWTSGAGAAVRLSVNGTQQPHATVNTSGRTVGYGRLGAAGYSSNNGTLAGSLAFDAFTSARYGF